MAMSKITILSFYNWLKAEDDDLFKNLKLPSGIDRDVLINNILLNAADFELLYSNPSFMQSMIDIWSNKWYRTFEKWVNALSIDYEPLYNYDRHETYTDVENNTSTNNGTVNIKGDNTSTGTVTDEGVNTEKISAYDSDVLHPNTSNESNNTQTNDLKGTTSSAQVSVNTQNDNIRREHNAHLYGNIGVTTTQDMLKSELDIAKWNMYEHITDLFLKEFCILIYV